MATIPFYIVDVFAVGKFTGNQLAVFLNAGDLSDLQMQKIAKEMNYSETTFITSSTLQDGGYNVRIFTPVKELPFAGHPTLGTAFIIQQALIQQPVEQVNLNLQVGQIPVTWEGESREFLWMRQNPPTFNQEFPATTLAQVLNLKLEEIDIAFPIQGVSTGIPFIIVPLKTHASLKECRINKEKYFEFVEKTEAKEIIIFCSQTYSQENQLSVRVFAEYLGIPEDPATGSANGCLAGYLVQHHYFGSDSINVRVEQGYEIGRPSLLLLRADRENDRIEVNVGGQVEMIAKGELIA